MHTNHSNTNNYTGIWIIIYIQFYLSKNDKNLIMKYDEELWKTYTDENIGKIQEDQSKFIYFLSVALGAKKICEAGCNVGNNLSNFPENCEVYGFDMNNYALEKARKRFPSFKFALQKNLPLTVMVFLYGNRII